MRGSDGSKSYCSIWLFEEFWKGRTAERILFILSSVRRPLRTERP